MGITYSISGVEQTFENMEKNMETMETFENMEKTFENMEKTFENMESNIFDLRRDVECHRDWTFIAETGVLPSSITLKSNMPCMYNVDVQYSSISYAVAYVLSYATVTLFRPSVQFIDQTMKSLNVVSSRMAIKSIQKFGVCEESEYAESPDNFLFPSEECFLQAQNFKSIGYFKVKFETMKRALCMGYPIIACLEIFNKDQIFEYNINEPKDRADALGNIAIVVTGYDDTSLKFEYLNCVNSEWGTCDYSIVKKYGHSMWVLKTSNENVVL